MGAVGTEAATEAGTAVVMAAGVAAEERSWEAAGLGTADGIGMRLTVDFSIGRTSIAVLTARTPAMPATVPIRERTQ